ncbi:hypothetical protein MJO28_002084 [Puccinia striiformis f. sp. tritici]|nr:hypothetical protein Pst134EB_003808 [Puccinia striiformis f. sp. tritici]KAI7961595.1 hypothetical protein MJO28_002084 [Puccinia striiformis f. sp. tritici]
MDSNHHNTSTDNPAPTNHLPTTGNQTAPECGLVFDNDDGLQRMMDEQPKDDHHMSTGAVKLTYDAMAQYASMDLESLCAAASHYAI